MLDLKWLRYGVVVGLAGCGSSVTGDGTASADSSSTSGPMTITLTGDESTSATPTTNPPSGSSTAPGDSSSSTGPGPGMCPAVEGWACETPVDCGTLGCGGWNSVFDNLGCLRPPCDDTFDCAPNEICWTPASYGGCVGGGTTCSMQGDACTCASDDDCGASFCMPDNQVPEADCTAFADEASCVDGGCGPFAMGRPIQGDPGGACLCDLDEPFCLFDAPDGTAVMGNTGYRNLATGQVVVFDTDFNPAPIGWERCDALVDVPECDCLEFLPCAMGL